MIFAQQGKTGRSSPEPAPSMRHAIYRGRLGRSFQSEDEHVAPRGTAALDEVAWQATASGDDP
jgi:hypothetical protein